MEISFKNTKEFELNNLAATICFPSGIKVCYSEKEPIAIKDYVTPITNQKGERYYMMTYHFYYKIMNSDYDVKYEMHPLKHHLRYFGDAYLMLSEEEFDEKITKKIQENLDICQELGFREYVYVPFCLCIISKYPYSNEMSKCLQCIYNIMFEDNLINKNKLNLKMNDVIMHLIHSVPIPTEKNTQVNFYLPFNENNISIKCPKVDEINIMNINYISLINLFSIDIIVKILRLMLSEKKILFIDDDYSRLTEVTDAFTSLLYPFKWIHTYIPIMSDQMLRYLETFLPFLNGIHSSLIPLISKQFSEGELDNEEEIFLIYIKLNKIKLGSTLNVNRKTKVHKTKYIQTNVIPLPYNIEKKLKKNLDDIKYNYDSAIKSKKDVNNFNKENKEKTTEYNVKIRETFIEMFAQLFADYPKYICLLDIDVVFNKNLFMNTLKPEDKRFYDEFIDSQLFQQFTQNIFSDDFNYFNKTIISLSHKTEE